MRTIQIKDLKVGDKLPDGEKYKHGQYINISVNSIRLTKAGRFIISIDRTYIHPEGSEQKELNCNYSNGALNGNTFIVVQ